MSQLLIEDVVVDGRAVDIRCEQGRVATIEPRTSAGAGAEPPEADDVLDGRGCTARAPLINSHTHAAMTLFRGGGDDLPLLEWLETRVWPYERGITEDEVYAGARLAIAEMVRAGTLFFNDMYWHPRAVIRAVEDLGVRGCIGQAFFDFGDPQSSRQLRGDYERLFADAGTFSDRVSLSVSAHSIYTVSEDSLRWAGELACAHDAVFHTHLAETEQEVEDCAREHGASPVEYLDRLGLLSERTVAAHTVWLSGDDVRRLGERRVVCAHNPTSNMKLAVRGVYPYRKLRAAGAVCAIATDGAGSNNNLDLLEELKVAALLQKHHEGDPTALPAEEALAMADANPAQAFGLSGPALEPGREADLILIDRDRPELTPGHSLASDLVYSAGGGVVDSAVCDGRVVMRHREIEGEEEIRAAAREAAASMFARVDRA